MATKFTLTMLVAFGSFASAIVTLTYDGDRIVGVDFVLPLLPTAPTPMGKFIPVSNAQSPTNDEQGSKAIKPNVGPRPQKLSTSLLCNNAHTENTTRNSEICKDNS